MRWYLVGRGESSSLCARGRKVENESDRPGRDEVQSSPPLLPIRFLHLLHHRTQLTHVSLSFYRILRFGERLEKEGIKFRWV